MLEARHKRQQRQQPQDTRASVQSVAAHRHDEHSVALGGCWCRFRRGRLVDRDDISSAQGTATTPLHTAASQQSSRYQRTVPRVGSFGGFHR
jgi:hypothetical protein